MVKFVCLRFFEWWLEARSYTYYPPPPDPLLGATSYLGLRRLVRLEWWAICYTTGAWLNKKLTLSPLCVLRQASASVGLISIISILLHRPSLSPSGTVFVTTTLLSLLPFKVSMAFPERMPWVTMATTSRAPCAITVSAALTRVPHVSAMSSTRIAMRSWTSPTSTMRLTSLGRGRSLWIRANPRSSLSAMEVAL